MFSVIIMLMTSIGARIECFKNIFKIFSSTQNVHRGNKTLHCFLYIQCVQLWDKESVQPTNIRVISEHVVSVFVFFLEFVNIFKEFYKCGETIIHTEPIHETKIPT